MTEEQLFFKVIFIINKHISTSTFFLILNEQYIKKPVVSIALFLRADTILFKLKK